MIKKQSVLGKQTKESRLDGLDVDGLSVGSGMSHDLDMTKDKKNVARHTQDLFRGSAAPRGQDTLSDVEDPVEREKIFRHSLQRGVMKNVSDSPFKNRMPKNLQIYQAKETENNKGRPMGAARTKEDPIFGMDRTNRDKAALDATRGKQQKLVDLGSIMPGMRGYDQEAGSRCKKIDEDGLMNGHQEWFELENEKALKRREIDITKDFVFNPVKLKCRKHPT